MDFHYTPDEEAFRGELRAGLDAHVPQDWPDAHDRDVNDPEYGARLKAWQRTLGQDSWAAINWPKEFGGRAASIMEQAIYSEEMARYDAPPQVNVIGLGMCGPTIMTCGTEEQKQRYLPRLLSGEDVWVQGFSEPGAGSDVAGLRTAAVEDGDDFIVNGQKVWITFAQHADYLMALVRTNPDVPKHKGLSMLIVPLDTPGVTVRPLKQITGDAEFNEIFFDNVRIPKANLIGDQDDGWRVAITTLMFERVNVSSFVQIQRGLERVVRLAQDTTRGGRPLSEDPLVRDRLAQLNTELKCLHLNELRALSKRARGDVPGPEGSVAKLLQSSLAQKVAALAVELQGPFSQLMENTPYHDGDGSLSRGFLRSQAATIAGGTTAIMKNIISERVLGLPKG